MAHRKNKTHASFRSLGIFVCVQQQDFFTAGQAQGSDMPKQRPPPSSSLAYETYLRSERGFHASWAERSISGELEGKVPSSTMTHWLLTYQPALQRENSSQITIISNISQKPFFFKPSLENPKFALVNTFS